MRTAGEVIFATVSRLIHQVFNSLADRNPRISDFASSIAFGDEDAELRFSSVFSPV
jgi:hypothetical protein